MNGTENDDQMSSPQPPASGGDNEPTSRPHEPTTMRLPGIHDLEQVDTSAETEIALSKADQATVDALRPGTALLVVLRGPNTGARFLLDAAEVSSGRHPDSDIFLDDVTVSRRHATFRREGEGYAVHDIGSLNGTYVNRERIDDHVLSTGDEVQIGKFRLVFYGASQR
jgi:pSer/pThr/pTyr-binding forkhead associated (FHA) protein